MSLRFDHISDDDTSFIRDIYNHYIKNTTVTFRLTPLEDKDIQMIHPFGEKTYPTFLILENNYPLGFCAITRFKNKEAYNRTAEVCVYLKPDKTGKGTGLKSLAFIEKIALKNGIKVLLAFITAENESSVKAFAKAGYTGCAHFKNIGEKFNRVLDVVVYQKELE